MYKKIQCIILVIALICGLIPTMGISSYAEGSVNEVRVRIEGKTDTLYNDKKTVIEEVYALDILKNAVGEENISGSESLYGYLVTGIMDEESDNNNGWSYYVKLKDGDIVQPMVSVDKFNNFTNEDGDFICEELVFYMTSYSGTNILTKIPKVIVENEGAEFTIKVVDYSDDKKPIEDVDVIINSEGSYKTDEKGEVKIILKKAGTYDVLISKDRDYPMIVRQHLILESEGDNSEELENVIEELKNTYKDKTDLSAREVMSYNNLMNNKDNYIRSFKLNQSDNAAAYAENIMGSLATGQDPSFYVEKLIDYQNEDGWFVVNAIDNGSVTTLADTIVALDMAKADYDVEKAVMAIVNEAKDGHYEDVITTAAALKALVNHKNMENIDSLIESCINYLKEEQLDSGGYDYYSMGNSPYTTGPVVQALVLAGEDLSGSDWIKEGRTLIDSLLACKVEGKGFEFLEGMGGGFDDPEATGLAFAALSDYYSGTSMYEKFVKEEKSEDKNYDEIIDTAIDGLRDYFTSMTERLDATWQSHPAFYRPLEALALNSTSKDIKNDIEDIADKFNINENEGTLPYAMNIIGLTSAGKNPQKYIDLLLEGQQEDGSFKVGTVEQTEWAVIALDMAGIDYDVEKAVSKIMDKNKNEEGIDLVAIALIALAPHKDIENVESFINSKLDYIRSKQLSTGGFEFTDGLGENSLSISYVISALVANGINPLTDEEWIKDGNTILDALLQYKKLSYFIYNESFGDYLYKDEATEQAFIALSDLKNMVTSFQNVQRFESYTGKIEEGLLKLRNYLITTEKRMNNSLEEVDVYYTWMEALAMTATSEDIDKNYEDIQKKLSLSDKEDVLTYAENIIGAIASGEVISKIEEDYVQNLISLQGSDGVFKKEQEGNVKKQAKAIIALDMTGVEYEADKAVNALLNMNEGDNFGDIEETAWALIALSKHTDIQGVSEIIDKAINYLKENQSDTGGFDMMGYGDTPLYTGLVVQALIANDIDPLSEEWIKTGNNLVDSLLNDQLDDGTFRISEMLGNYSDIQSTSRAFGALADLYTGISMYHSVEPVLDPSDVIGNAIKDAKEYVRNQNQYNYLQSMALSVNGIDKKEILARLEFREDEAKRVFIIYDDPTEAHAKNIMGLIAAGEDARNYKGKNYVKILVDSQNEDGIFNIEGKETNSLRDQANSIIALDMAGADYDREKAINVLLNKYEQEKNKLSIYDVSSVIIALSNYKDMDNNISECIEILKSMQLESGGFGYNKNSTSESSEYDAVAIQALVAAGKDPLAEEFQINGKTVLDALMKFKRDDHFIYDEQKASYREYTDEANGMVLAALTDLINEESMYQTLAIEYTEEPSREYDIKDIVEDIRAYYSNKVEFSFREAIGYRYTSEDLEKDLPLIQSKFKINENKSASAYAGNIIGLIAAGKNPKDYKGKNYVKELADSQNEEGKFIIGTYDDYPTTIVFSIIALDMANGEYDRDGAVKALLSYQDPDNSFGGVDETAMSLIALDDYRDIEGVEEAIGNGINYLKTVQLDTGGFEAWGSENPYSISAVIQGLIAVGENPLSDEWIKNGNTMLDSLLSFKVNDHFENKSEWGTEIDMATEQAFIALADLLKGKSMFKEIKFEEIEPARIEIENPSVDILRENGKLKLNANVFDKDNNLVTGLNLIWESMDTNIAEVDQEGLITARQIGKAVIIVKVEGYENIKDTIEITIEPEEIEIERVGNDQIRKGTEGYVKINIINNSDESIKATFIIVLYDKNTNEMINYSYVEQYLNAKESKDMGAGFLIPEKGDYIIKGLVWDDMENQNVILTNPLIIEVK